MKLGANYLGNDTCEFTVWAPILKQVTLKIVTPEERLVPMTREDEIEGIWRVTVENIKPGTQYFYQLENDKERPDSASYYQPQGVHGPSEVVDLNNYQWQDQNWAGVPVEEIIIYELHVGTFTPEGTFEAIIPYLKDLQELGINTIEIMPIGQFPGSRNWGYDGVYPYAPQNSYGGPLGLKKLVDACHQHNISVILDVIYNHLGPEGNYIAEYGPYFTDRYKASWGNALNFDEQYSDAVRDFFIENALYWLRDYHIDGLRLDAIQAIYEVNARPFLQELSERVQLLGKELGKKFYLTAESDLNDVRVLQSKEFNGFGLDAQWCDDFHHSLHCLLTGENDRYYKDFGTCYHLEKCFRDSFFYTGQYAPHRRRKFGKDSRQQPAHQFIVFCQTHDQIGNRINGDRLSSLINLDGLKLGAGTILISPYIPFLFMGEEYGETAPFYYFISHGDPELIEAVRKDKEQEFKHFEGRGEYQDPQSETTFNKSKLNWQLKQQGHHKILWQWHQKLIAMRRTLPALKKLDKDSLEVSSNEEGKILLLRRWTENQQIFALMNFNSQNTIISPELPPGNWQKILDSSEEKWLGKGSTLPDSFTGETKLNITPQTFAVYSL